MALQRTGSARSTLSMMQRKATQYERYISLASVFLLVTSTIIIFTSIVLIKWYFMPNLAFWDSMFVVAPYLMLGLGIYKFIISLYGFGVTSSENKGLLVFFAILLALAFVGTVASIFTFWQVKTQVDIGSVGQSEAIKELMEYGKEGSESITNSWDRMQSHLHCCGIRGHNIGYNDYKSTKFGQDQHGKFPSFDGVPDSCCVTTAPNCGNGVQAQGKEKVRNTIYVDGCMEILQEWMEEDIVSMIIVYCVVGIIMAMVELIACVLVCAYVAQISRRRKREEMMWNAVRGDDNGDNRGGGEMTPMHTFDRTSNHDTQV